MRNAKFGKRNPQDEIRKAGCANRNPKSEFRKPKWKADLGCAKLKGSRRYSMRSSESEIQKAKSEVRATQIEIRNPKLEIRNANVILIAMLFIIQ